jgi:hypothetical protein
MGVGLKLAVSVAALAALAAMVDVTAALKALAGIEPGHALLASVLFLLTHLTNAAKLRVLLPERTLGGLFALILVAQAYAMLLPGQIAGEAVKVFRLGRGPGGCTGRATSAVVFDKVTGAAAVLVLTLVGLVLDTGHFGGGLAWAAGLGLMGLAAGVTALTLQRMVRLASRLAGAAGRAGRIGDLAGRFLETWREQAAHPATVVRSLAWGLVAQFLVVAGSAVLAQALDIDLPLAVWCVVGGALTLVLLAPVTVGGIGLRDVSLVGLLSTVGIAADRALALSLAMLAFQLAMTAAGLSIDLIAAWRHEVKSIKS